MTPHLFRLFACALLTMLMLCPVASQADEGRIDIHSPDIEKTTAGYRLSVRYSFSLSKELENALHLGIPLYFTTEIRVFRPRWYWFDEVPVSASRTVRISYNVLTREYGVTSFGSIQQNFNSLENALFLIRRPYRWNIAEPDQLTSGETYTASIRMMLDISQLPKTFQINVINNRDWRLSSDWQRFYFTA